MNFHSSFMAGMAATVVLLSGGPADAQSLNDALAAAYASNPTLLAARAELRAVDEGVPQALGNWRPEVEITGDAGVDRSFNNQRTGDKTITTNPVGAGVSLTQSIYRGGRTVAETASAESSVLAERARLVAVEQSVLFDAATAYADVYRDQAVLALNVNNEQVLRRQLEATNDRFSVGEVTRTDVNQAEARLAGATADRVAAEGNLQVSRATYKKVVGEMPPQTVLPDAPVELLPGSLESALDQAQQANPTLLAARFDEAAARHDVRLVKGELLPEISLEASANYDEEGTSRTSRTHDRSVVARLTMPLYQQGVVYSRLREAKQTAQQFRRLIDEAERDTQEEATQAWETLTSARAQIKSFQAQIVANEVALEGVEREAQVGSRTVLDILDAEQELLDSRVNLVRAQRDEIVAIFQLMSATGVLTADRLGLGVELYDPKAHYDEVRGKWFGGSSAGDR